MIWTSFVATTRLNNNGMARASNARIATIDAKKVYIIFSASKNLSISFPFKENIL